MNEPDVVTLSKAILTTKPDNAWRRVFPRMRGAVSYAASMPAQRVTGNPKASWRLMSYDHTAAPLDQGVRHMEQFIYLCGLALRICHPSMVNPAVWQLWREGVEHYTTYIYLHSALSTLRRDEPLTTQTFRVLSKAIDTTSKLYREYWSTVDMSAIRLSAIPDLTAEYWWMLRTAPPEDLPPYLPADPAGIEA